MWSRCLPVLLALAAVPARPATVRARVLFFVATDCVYSDRYFPEMLRLQQEFATRGVTFTWVYPNRNEQLAAVQGHQRQFSAPVADAVLDRDGSLTRQAAVRITPEAAVLVPGPGDTWTTAYHGRIDDRYVRIGLERPQASHHDLELAIAAVLAGRPAVPASGNPVGCGIMSGP
jgi:hypothetical protein